MPEHQQIQQSKKPDTIFQKQATPATLTHVSNPYSIIQRAKINPKSLTHADIMQLQRTIGNRAVGMLLSSIGSSSTAQQAIVQRQEIPEEEEPLQGKFAEPIQRQEIPEEEEPLQGKMIDTIQRQEIPEEEEPLQGKFENKPEIVCPSCFATPIVQRQEIPEEEEPLQGKMIETIQRQEIPEEEEPLQGKMAETIQFQEIPEEEEPLQGKIIGTIQRQEIPEEEEPLQSKRENNTGMPDNLKAGVESLSGIDMSDVRVHYNSSKPANVGALAYTQGTDIHVAPGQEKHLPHEAWHVVQQKQGSVRPTMQMHGGLNVNDDEVLEHEADKMGGCVSAQLQQFDVDEQNGLDTSCDQPVSLKSRKVASSSNKEGVIQQVRGGIEYTEDGPTMLYAYVGPFVNNVAAHNNFTVKGRPMTGFRVGAGINPNVDLGNWTNQDLDVLRSSATVKLTNDVQSAEWIIERHRNDVPVDTMRQNLKEDVDFMFQTRDALIASVNDLRHGAGEAAITDGTKADTNTSPHVFIYQPGPKKGKAQITAQYSNEDTIRRINMLNVSKYLTGTKVGVGEDIPRITGTADQALIQADIDGTTSFSTAEVLLNGLRGTSVAIPRTGRGGVLRLTQHQVGLIKLMVLNDALATTMVRYQDIVGQAQEKNIQRFFPKSRRDEYVKTIAQAHLDATEMGLLRAEIQRTSAADAQLLFNNADPGALRTDEAFSELGVAHPTMGRMLDARRRLADPTLGAPDPIDLQNIKTAVLGRNGALLATWINRASLAYTDLTANATQHVFHDPGKANQNDDDIATYGVDGGGSVGSVIETSRGFTPVAGGGQGAIYEMREREIVIDKSGFLNIGSLDEMNNAIDRIFNAVD